MEILISIKELKNRADIVKAFNLLCMDIYKLSVIPDNYKITLSEKEAEKLGLIIGDN